MGHLDVTKCLISLGAEVNNRDINDVTALHNAAFSGHLDVTKCLIGKGAELAQNDSSEIHLAIQHGHTSVIEKLVSEGADLNISDEYYMGELSPERALVFYLLENGAKLDVKDGTGNLPIQYAKDEVLKQMILWR
eukprot:XP_011661648.1 PREDICTED: ankyrin repeat domain-containing protein 2-like [Strongylocentrotus purpuratus]